MSKDIIVLTILIVTATVFGYYYMNDKLHFDWINQNRINISSSSTHYSNNGNDREKNHHEYKFDNNGSLTVANINGLVTVKTHNKDTLILNSIKRGSKDDFDKLETKTEVS